MNSCGVLLAACLLDTQKIFSAAGGGNTSEQPKQKAFIGSRLFKGKSRQGELQAMKIIHLVMNASGSLRGIQQTGFSLMCILLQ